MNKLEIINNQFYYKGEMLRIISGAVHYFRIVPEYWKDRLMKLKACGFNTVETYIPWNFHEPNKDVFNFKGMADVESFIRLAQEIGLHVIVRPSPYICAEWEFGGLPAWLLNIEGIKLRCFNKPFLDRVDLYYDELFKRLKPLMSTNGGPIIAMQVENEYGSYGSDKKYLNYIKDGMLKRGVDVLLFTSDGPTDLMLEGGTLDGVLKTVNFGSEPEEAFEKLREHQDNAPIMCTEFWNGWFDHWGENHHTRDPKDAAEVLDAILSEGSSVNLYMFHGGTNFGFMNGANYDNKIQPTVTSYDYDSPLNEAGDPTDKYFLMRDVIKKYTEVDVNYNAPVSPKAKYGKVELNESVGLFEALTSISKPVELDYPVPMEKLGQNYGYILYRTHLNGQKSDDDNYIILQHVHDRAYIFINQSFCGIVERDTEEKLKVKIPKDGCTLNIIVENCGRINYGPKLGDYKGITEGVRLNYQFISNWTAYCLPLDNLEKLEYKNDTSRHIPGFFKGRFNVINPKDTFLSTEGWGKGIAFINGLNLGRYYKAGPQKTLYVPAPLLNYGENEVVLFELEGFDKTSICFKDKPDLG